jgi:hypothetical protein
MVKRSLIIILSWLIACQPAWSACGIDGFINFGSDVTPATVSLSIPSQTTSAFPTSSKDRVAILHAATIAETVNSVGGAPIITSIVGGAPWNLRARERGKVGDGGANKCQARKTTERG